MSTDSSCAAADDHVSTPAWLQNGGFIPVLLGIAAMFWAISFVCEEYGVPALAAFCKRNKLSDALTGSIFIGTGLSLPVFFVAVAGLFASHSAIGVGAVVGGNLFNHLFTIGTSIYVCPDRVMKLDPYVFTREILIYFLSCLLVLWTVGNGHFAKMFNTAFQKEQWESCLTISWEYSLALVAAYVAYCILDGNFYLIEEFCRKWWYPPTDRAEVIRQSDNSRELDVVEETDEVGSQRQLINQLTVTSAESPVPTIPPPETSPEHDGNAALPEIPAVADVEQGIRLSTSSNNSKVASSDDLNLAIAKVSEEITVEEVKAKSMMDSAFDQGDRYLDILSLPRESGAIQKGFFYMAFPLRYAIFLTTPDVRRPGSESRAIWSMCVTIVWLAILSYVLTAALTLIGNWWHISSAVMGITVAAWASNFPAHWSSMVVSRHGFGDVSCCNCLGSNTFNNLIGLGLPWLLYSIVYRGQPYDALQDDGVAISVFCMMITIVVHYVVVWQSNWVLREWMIAPMVLAYVAEIAFLAYFYSVLA